MRVLILVAIIASAAAFAPAVKTDGPRTVLDVHRRDVLAGFAGMLAAPTIANAAGSTFFFDDKIETVKEASQMATGGRVDLNNAFVVRLFGLVCGYLYLAKGFG